MSTESTFGAFEISNHSDAAFRDGVEIVGRAQKFGRDGAKVPVNRGVVAQFRPSVIGLGPVEVEKAQVLVYASDTDSGTPMLADFAVLAPDPRIAVVTGPFFHTGLMAYEALGVSPGLIAAWDLNVASGADSYVEYYIDNADNGGLLTVGQTWTYNGDLVDDELKFHRINGIYRSGLTNGALFGPDLYTVKGSAGSYEKDTLVRSAGRLDADTWLSQTPNSLAFGLNPVETLVPGTIYHTEWVVTGGSGVHNIFFPIKSTGDGSSDNYTTYPNSGGMSGFHGGQLWDRGDHIKDATTVSSVDNDITVPAFTAGTVYSFGDGTGYGTTANLPNFIAGIKEALQARTSTNDLIAVRIQDFDGSTDDVQRRIKGILDADTFETLPGFYGMTLQITYTGPPGTRHQRRKRRGRC